MITFCFNDCLGNVGCDKEQIESLFCSLLTAHSRLGTSVNYPIILPSAPDKIMVAGISLKQIVEAIPADKDNINIRRLAYSFFDKYPLTSFFTSAPELQDDDCMVYRFLGNDAESLFWTHKMGWIAISVPVCEAVRKNILSLEPKDAEKDVNNWYGNNSEYVKGLEKDNDNAAKKRLEKLKCFFADKGKDVYMSDSFMKNFEKSPVGMQELVQGKFTDAYNANLLFPSKGDDNLVKYCEGKGNETTYELRSKALGGMRVYFYSDDNTLIVASLHTKSQSAGNEQSADINNSSAIIRKIKRKEDI